MTFVAFPIVTLVLPARAGVILKGGDTIIIQWGPSRASGGDPMTELTKKFTYLSFPRERG